MTYTVKIKTFSNGSITFDATAAGVQIDDRPGVVLFDMVNDLRPVGATRFDFDSGGRRVEGNRAIAKRPDNDVVAHWITPIARSAATTSVPDCAHSIVTSLRAGTPLMSRMASFVPSITP